MSSCAHLQIFWYCSKSPDVLFNFLDSGSTDSRKSSCGQQNDVYCSLSWAPLKYIPILKPYLSLCVHEEISEKSHRAEKFFLHLVWTKFLKFLRTPYTWELPAIAWYQEVCSEFASNVYAVKLMAGQLASEFTIFLTCQDWVICLECLPGGIRGDDRVGSQVEIISDPKFRRLKATIDIALAIKLYYSSQWVICLKSCWHLISLVR